jgi:hypothetical protein
MGAVRPSAHQRYLADQPGKKLVGDLRALTRRLALAREMDRVADLPPRGTPSGHIRLIEIQRHLVASQGLPNRKIWEELAREH